MAAPRIAIASLPEKTAPAGADLLVIQDGSTTKKMTQTNFNSVLVAGGNGITAIVAMTQVAYDALTPKVATTLYIITS
jgi:ferredoxin-NADP reductase